jgi:hypothetical protein
MISTSTSFGRFIVIFISSASTHGRSKPCSFIMLWKNDKMNLAGRNLALNELFINCNCCDIILESTRLFAISIARTCLVL